MRSDGVWHDKRGKLFDNIGKRTGIDGNIPDEGHPLPLFCRISRERGRQGIRKIDRNFRFAAFEGSGDRAREAVFVKHVRAR
jgi:hypothetical protein